MGAFQDTSTVHEVEQWHKHTVLCISLSKLVSCAFSTIPICPFFNSSFTCLHSFFTCLKQIACLLLFLHQPRIEFPRTGRIQSVGLCTQYTKEMCALCTSPNCGTDSSPEKQGKSPICMFLHTILPWVRKL